MNPLVGFSGHTDDWQTGIYWFLCCWLGYLVEKTRYSVFSGWLVVFSTLLRKAVRHNLSRVNSFVTRVRQNHSRLLPICDDGYATPFLFNVATVVLLPYSNRGGERRWPQNKTGVVHRYQATVDRTHGSAFLGCHWASNSLASSVALAIILGTPCQLIWRSHCRRWNLRVPYLQMSCSDLT